MKYVIGYYSIINQYFMKTEAAQAAALIRKELKSAFPNVKFSVRSQTYSGGDAVYVSYTDGPVQADVQKITGKYQMGHFDGMIDLYEYDNTRDDIPQAKHVMVTRSWSEEVKNELVAKYEKIDGFDIRKYNDEMWVRGEFAKTAY